MLTDAAIKALKAQEKPYKKADREGLYLLVRPNGSKLWQQSYRFAGKLLAGINHGKGVLTTPEGFKVDGEIKDGKTIGEAHAFYKDKAGDLGEFNRETMEKPFTETAFKLKVGEISDVVETKFGFHIIKRTK